MINALRQNIETELRMLSEISRYSQMLDYSSISEQKLLAQAIEALKRGIKIVNDNVPQLLGSISIVPKLPEPSTQKIVDKPAAVGAKPVTVGALQQIRFKSIDADVAVTLQERDKERFLRELSITDQLMKKIRHKPLAMQTEKPEEFRAASGYLKLANQVYLPLASKLTNQGYFKSLAIELRKANLDILFTTYISMIFLSVTIFFGFALLVAVFFFFMSFSINNPLFFAPAESLSFVRALKVLLIPLLTPGLVFLALYYYPATERSSLAKKIEQELPFAVIHMSAISGSGIEPTQIFKIIGLSREYNALRKEIRKVMNQINLYGYDLVNSLISVAATTPSIKLAELFSGLATTITSGGSLGDFFEKRAETLLISYRLEREKFTKIAETFMDVYISLVIAAPMILMIILVIISVSKLNTGLAPFEMTLLIIFVIGILNALFIGFLHVKQPAY